MVSSEPKTLRFDFQYALAEKGGLHSHTASIDVHPRGTAGLVSGKRLTQVFVRLGSHGTSTDFK